VNPAAPTGDSASAAPTGEAPPPTAAEAVPDAWAGLSDEEIAGFRALEARIGVAFRRRELLREAMTHASWNNERGEPSGPGKDNERLEYLGDAVLELVVGEYLFRRFPSYDEGQLTGRNLRMISAAGSRAGNSLDALAGLVEARDAIAGRIALAVPLLRARGYSDPEIAATLGTTRQAVGQAFGRKRRFTPGPAGTGGAA